MKWPSINPGELRHPVTIRTLTATTDASGASVTPSDFATAYAKIEFKSGTERLQDGQGTARVDAIITIRYQAGILPNMSVVGPNGTYTIQAIEDVNGMNVLLKLYCLAIGANR